MTIHHLIKQFKDNICHHLPFDLKESHKIVQKLFPETNFFAFKIINND